MFGPSEAFVRLTRNPQLEPPKKVERTEKRAGDVEIVTYRRKAA